MLKSGQLQQPLFLPSLATACRQVIYVSHLSSSTWGLCKGEIMLKSASAAFFGALSCGCLPFGYCWQPPSP